MAKQKKKLPAKEFFTEIRADKKNTKERLPEIRVYGVSPTLVEQLINISKNLNVSLADFLKPHLRKIADSYPDKMKQIEKLISE